MLVSKGKGHVLPRISALTRRFSTVQPRQDDEYTTTPQYPPILDLSVEAKHKRFHEAKHEAIRAVKTVEEKQIKLNMPRYYGFKCYLFQEDDAPYNTLPLVQHITRTHLKKSNGLPEFYTGLNVDVDGIYEGLKGDIEEVILLEYEGIKAKHKVLQTEMNPGEIENVLSSSVSRQINRLLSSALSDQFPHLKTAQIDEDPRIESFWVAGGMNPSTHVGKSRAGHPFLKQFENDPHDKTIQYTGLPVLNLRSDLPLPPVVPASEAENPELDVPYFKYEPRVVQRLTKHQHGANIPGYWPGDTNQFAVLSYHRRGYMRERRDFKNPEEAQEALHRQGILASYAWLNAQANFQGFTTYNDITYPLVTQTIITNGQKWSFYIYQLNTLLVHGKNVTDNPKRNICWAIPDLKLFEEVADSKVVGLNDNVLKTLIKIYANAPGERLGVNLRPYLSNDEKISADYADDDKSNWLEREYKYLMSNRPRQKLPYEIYSWEKIYKIDHKTRPMEKRLRPFELFKNPYNRTLDDRQAFYIPRAERPDLPRNKGRYHKEYFP